MVEGIFGQQTENKITDIKIKPSVAAFTAKDPTDKTAYLEKDEPKN